MKFGRTGTLKSAKYIQKRKKKAIINALIISLSSIVILILILLCLRIPFIQIKSIEITNTKTIDTNDLISIANKDIVDNYFYLIPKSNILFYPKSRILSDVIDNNKKIKSATAGIENIFGFSPVLNVKIEERIPYSIVCNGFSDDEDISDCYISDESGYVFDKLNNDDLTKYNISTIRYYINSSSNPIVIGNEFINSIRFKELEKFLNNIKDSGININGLLINDDNSYEMYIENIDHSRAVVYFDDRISFDKTLSNFLTFWQNAQYKKIGMDSIPSFDYINLRFGNNIFYLVK